MILFWNGYQPNKSGTYREPADGIEKEAKVKSGTELKVFIEEGYHSNN